MPKCLSQGWAWTFRSRLCLNVLVKGKHEHFSEATCLKHISVKCMLDCFTPAVWSTLNVVASLNSLCCTAGVMCCCVFERQEYYVRYIYVSHNVSQRNVTLVTYWVCVCVSVGMATRYWLDSSGDRNPVGARFSAPVQTGPGAHPASYTMGTGSLSRG